MAIALDGCHWMEKFSGFWRGIRQLQVAGTDGRARRADFLACKRKPVSAHLAQTSEHVAYSGGADGEEGLKNACIISKLLKRSGLGRMLYGWKFPHNIPKREMMRMTFQITPQNSMLYGWVPSGESLKGRFNVFRLINSWAAIHKYGKVND